MTGCKAEATQKAPAVETISLQISRDAKLVSLFFDDAFLNQYDIALPILMEYGFRATFGVITGSIGDGHGLWEYMSEKELKRLAGYGMDIASHTITHPNLTENLTDEQLRREIFDSKKELEEIGFQVTTMIYPYYECDGRVIEYVKEAGYRWARAGWTKEKACQLEMGQCKKKYEIFSWQITNQDMETYKKYLHEAGPDRLVGLTYHFISDNGPTTTSTTVENFKEQMAYLADEDFTVVTFPQLFGR